MAQLSARVGSEAGEHDVQRLGVVAAVVLVLTMVELPGDTTGAEHHQRQPGRGLSWGCRTPSWGWVILPRVVRRSGLVLAASDGCYEASRAAALSGVPKSTVYWWARHGVVVPSVSPSQEKLWSYTDLMVLRVVSWLRHPKLDAEGARLPASPMSQVRRALELLDEAGLDLWSPHAHGQSPVLVDRSGRVYVRVDQQIINLHGQPALLPEDVLALTGPFQEAGLDGPDLLRPRPHLRIVPAKVAGEPHVERSRLTTQTVAALAARGYPPVSIAGMYEEPVTAIEEAIDLERQLAQSAVAA